MISNGNSVPCLLIKPAVQAASEVKDDPLVFVPGLEIPRIPSDFEPFWEGSCRMMCGHCDEYAVSLSPEFYPKIFQILLGYGLISTDPDSPVSHKGITFDKVLHHLESYISKNRNL